MLFVSGATLLSIMAPGVTASRVSDRGQEASSTYGSEDKAILGAVANRILQKIATRYNAECGEACSVSEDSVSRPVI